MVEPPSSSVRCPSAVQSAHRGQIRSEESNPNMRPLVWGVPAGARPALRQRVLTLAVRGLVVAGAVAARAEDRQEFHAP